MEPGGTFELRIPLKDVWLAQGSGTPGPIPAGRYDVQASVEIQVLIGEAEGPWKDLSPVRLFITSSTKGLKQ